MNPSLEDPSFNPALRNEAEAVFAARKDQPGFVDYEFVDYKGEFTCVNINKELPIKTT